MKKIALSTLLAATGIAQAQVTSFDTYRTTTVYTENGTFTASTPLYKPQTSEFDKWKRASKPYYDLMGKVAAQNGYEPQCVGVTEDAFLTGKTESSFRASEKALVKDFATTTPRYRAPKVLKAIPVSPLGHGITASFYIYQPTKPDLTSKTMYGYFFDSNVKQGVMLACVVFPK